MIEMNRITRILYKASLLTRQRDAIRYGSKYVISDRDLQKADQAKPDQASKLSDTLAETKLLDGFDPLENNQDRRILYEVTGLRLFENEFRDFDSSDYGS